MLVPKVLEAKLWDSVRGPEGSPDTHSASQDGRKDEKKKAKHFDPAAESLGRDRAAGQGAVSARVLGRIAADHR